MGLLDQILGSAAGGINAGSQQRNTGIGSSVLMALLPVVIGMLTNRGGSAGATGGLGGLGGLGSIPGMGGASSSGAGGLGGLGGAAGMGGLGSLIEQFTHKGYGSQANSWIGTGSNEALSPQAVSDVFGEDQIAQIAQQAGVNTEDARHGLSELLPSMVDHFTPQGQVPSLEHMSSSVDEFMKRMNSQRD
ncbi:YidB family protein (plasmid) [Comamonadaceae bacterium OTU4NAUVB1]|nr:YidB family protein [Comamonadaceae bacterium OTU4NAUVB1]